MQAISPNDIDAYLEQHQQKELLRFVAVGSVDDGKSTLIGRMLHDTHGIYEDQLSAVKRASARSGSAGDKVDLALLTDGLRAEREQGITIDVAYRYFSTDKRKFIIADTPGHVQYTRNMATGASTADMAIILIDARKGVQQQSRRHAYIASLLGIPYLAVCINKMDLVDFDQAAYDSICADFDGFASDLHFAQLNYFPISAVDGDNVVHASKRSAWYRGETLLSYLETVPINQHHNATRFRMPVQYVIRPNLNYRGFCGKVASGRVRVGDTVVVVPSGQRSTIMAIDTYDGELPEAYPPMSVTLRLADEVDISRGDMLTHVDDPPTSARVFDADVVWMSETPLVADGSYFLKHTTRTVRANVQVVQSRIDLQRLEQQPTDTLRLNDIGRLRLACNQALHFDRYGDNRELGAFILIDALTNDTVAAGMIRAAHALDDSGDTGLQLRGEVSFEQRRQRLGHRPMLLWFDGEPQEGEAEQAYELERQLHEQGIVATVIDVAAMADSSRSASLLTDVASQCLRAGLVAIFSSGLPRASDRQEVLRRIPESVRLRFAAVADVVEGPADGHPAERLAALLKRA